MFVGLTAEATINKPIELWEENGEEIFDEDDEEIFDDIQDGEVFDGGFHVANP